MRQEGGCAAAAVAAVAALRPHLGALLLALALLLLHLLLPLAREVVEGGGKVRWSEGRGTLARPPHPTPPPPWSRYPPSDTHPKLWVTAVGLWDLLLGRGAVSPITTHYRPPPAAAAAGGSKLVSGRGPVDGDGQPITLRTYLIFMLAGAVGLKVADNIRRVLLYAQPLQRHKVRPLPLPGPILACKALLRLSSRSPADSLRCTSCAAP
jgi:hypothetical protein